MLPTTKRTKRQKKGIAFRERKHSKRKDDRQDNLERETDDPSLEDQAPVDATQGQQGRQVSAKSFFGQGTTGTEGEETKAGRMVVAETKAKRKADEEEKEAIGESDQPRPKRRKGSHGGPCIGIEEHLADVRVGAGEADKDEKARQRFILFLGNLKYTTTLEAIQAHFSACIPPPIVRLLTPKPSANIPTKLAKSKGCAFLEFKHRSALQQGLKLHHSQLDGRQINLELTAGGGGKGATRMKKLRERNEELEGQRRKRKERTRVDAQPRGTQHVRNGMTSDVQEKESQRGSQRYKRGPKQRGSQVKDFRTGVNAIPLG